jgi:hypothetical protein
MSDPFNSLRRPAPSSDPDPHYRAELLLAVRRRLAGDGSAAPPRSQTTISISLEDTEMKTPHRNRWLMYAAAIVVIGGLTAFTIVRSDVDDAHPSGPAAPAPAPSVTTTTTPPTTTPPTTTTTATTTTTMPATTTTAVPTTTLPALSDEEVASAALLEAPDFQTSTGVAIQALDAGPDTLFQRGVAFDRAFAEQVPGCAPYLDAAFESSSRPAVTDARFFWTDELTNSMEPQYVAVFPDEASAQAMFEATADPGFLTDCAFGYLDVMLPTFNDHYIWFPYWKGSGEIASGLELAGDQSWYRTYHYDMADPLTPGIRMYSATVRVGRIVTVLTVEGEINADSQAVTDDEFEAVVARFVERAEAALRNQTSD